MNGDRPAPIAAGNACECPEMPINYWHHPDRGWQPGAQLSPANLPADDGERYLAGGFDVWCIACPTCGRVYAGGSNLDDIIVVKP